jgi:eukaryotic-like serine/threonine-protein kinase
MNITEPFVLKEDVLLIPVADLSDDVRGRLSYDQGDFTLSRRHGRVLAQVIDGETAALLSRFREPCTIADAVAEKSRALRKDPEAWLDELLPHLGRFLHSRILVPAGSEEEQELRPRLESGAKIGRWEIVRCVNFIEDTEVYQLRDGNAVAALKIARVARPPLQALFENETTVLGSLDGAGGITPRLLDSGLHEERPYLVMDWVPGVDVTVAAAQRRHDRASLIELCASIASAYAALHARGVLHADVHPRNVLAGERTMLVDFGYSRMASEPPRVGRGGLYSFFEPESLAGERQNVRVPPSAQGEQYSVAALLYLLITGRHYVDFRYEREEMIRQAEFDPPVPFAVRGIPPWPGIEEILFRGLEKDPARRYGSMAELAAVLGSARDTTVRQSLATPLSAAAHAFLEETLQSFARDGSMFATRYPLAPRASINYGCAGAAVGLLRIAETRSDPELLALADVWRSRAATLIGTEEAYYNAGAELSHETLGDITPYHTGSGIHAAGAMIAAAMGHSSARGNAIRAFLRASIRPCEQIDLTLGRSGSLLAAAMLLRISEDLPEAAAALRTFGAETMEFIWKKLAALPSIEASEGRYLGMAHGWAGYLYAAMRWCEASGDALPPRLAERLDELSAVRMQKGRGAFWPVRIGGAELMPGWCNGSAGQVFLFTLAHRLLGEAKWLELAELSAWNNWEEPCGPPTLCCGSAGRAYALLNLYKHTGATEWLARARQLANHAVGALSSSQRRNALWKGELGVAVLVADLASPENALMPFFE